MRTWLVIWLLAALVSQDKKEQSKPNPQKKSSQSTTPVSPQVATKAEVEQPLAKPKEQIAQSEDTSMHVGRILEKAFAPDTWPTWALVLVGVWAARIAIRTLKAIEHEARIARDIADAAKENAVAAKANALALIIENRPWLLLDKVEVRYLTPIVEVPHHEQRFSYCIVMTKNHGKSISTILKVASLLRAVGNRRTRTSKQT